MNTLFRVMALFTATSAAVSWSCGSGPASPTAAFSDPRSDNAMVEIVLTAEPEPVGSGAALTYRVDLGQSAGVAPHITLHLPVGALDPKTSGSGWACAVAAEGADPYQTGLHLDVSCSSVLMGLAALPLTVTVQAPTTSTQVLVRACAVAAPKPGLEGPEACAFTTVVP
ncbi:MAG: hypothetical protein E6K74_05695 [Candidatus Eisenbacteria bacterium]|uniref:DUF11 domain-containing protein n=1 Tax=Eiseniibacteriota bacterium TaxID=2212470 RepID=A0A538STG8_UNCEI|nr:MAG: hypothetical protein E6K74_05695 [Candidatus Eisenbacteria bacterium]